MLGLNLFKNYDVFQGQYCKINVSFLSSLRHSIKTNSRNSWLNVNDVTEHNFLDDVYEDKLKVRGDEYDLTVWSYDIKYYE